MCVHTAGPWDRDAPGGLGWLSIKCPQGERPINGGAAFWATDNEPASQVAGGFGSGHDGHWHYRFHNWAFHTIQIQLWAVCVNRT